MTSCSPIRFGIRKSGKIFRRVIRQKLDHPIISVRREFAAALKPGSKFAVGKDPFAEGAGADFRRRAPAKDLINDVCFCTHGSQ